MPNVLKAIFILITILIAGCADFQSLHNFTRDAVGQPISGIAAMDRQPGAWASRIGWQETTYQLKNGDRVYVEAYGPHIFIHWELNPQGIIVGYAVETVGRGETTLGKNFNGEFKHPGVTSR